MINFETYRIWNENKQEFILIGNKENFNSLFEIYQKNGFVRVRNINDDEGWANKQGNQIGTWHIWVDNFVNKRAVFKDIINGVEKWGWVNEQGKQIGTLHDWTLNFVNNHAQFQDTINGEEKYGWVNIQGNQIGTLHYATYDFENNHAKFYDAISDFEDKWGCVNYLGIEISATLETCEKLLELILKDFPENSMKLYILRKFL